MDKKNKTKNKNLILDHYIIIVRDYVRDNRLGIGVIIITYLLLSLLLKIPYINLYISLFYQYVILLLIASFALNIKGENMLKAFIFLLIIQGLCYLLGIAGYRDFLESLSYAVFIISIVLLLKEEVLHEKYAK